jgi:hypothetical protein
LLVAFLSNKMLRKLFPTNVKINKIQIQNYGNRVKRPSSKQGKMKLLEKDHNAEFYVNFIFFSKRKQLYEEWKKEGKQFNRDYYLQLLDNCISGIKEDPEKFSKKAVEIFEQFKKEYEPSMDEYNFLIQSYCLSNQLEKGFETWNLTKTLNLTSDQQTFDF